MALQIESIRKPALVSRIERTAGEPDRYLLISNDGPPRWTSDLEAATSFESMREATRAAARLPGSLRAFGIPAPSRAA